MFLRLDLRTQLCNLGITLGHSLLKTRFRLCLLPVKCGLRLDSRLLECSIRLGLGLFQRRSRLTRDEFERLLSE